MQGILSGTWITRSKRRLGVYGVYRHQLGPLEAVDAIETGTNEEFRRRTQVLAVDMHAAAPLDVGEWTLNLEAESALLTGGTDRALSYGAREQLGVLALGVAGHATLANPEDALKFHLRGAYGSGDGDGDDAVSHDFAFDRDYAAGLVLYDQVLGGVEAAQYNQLTDPENAGQGPDGADVLVTEGAVRKSAFVQPIVQGHPVPWLDLRAGVLVGFATAPYGQAYYSYRAGGVPMNQHDEPVDSRLLGTELDWGVGVRRDPDKEPRMRPTFDVQGGHLIVGPALSGAGPSVIHNIMGVARLEY